MRGIHLGRGAELSRARLGYRSVAELSTAEDMRVARVASPSRGSQCRRRLPLPRNALRLGDLVGGGQVSRPHSLNGGGASYQLWRSFCCRIRRRTLSRLARTQGHWVDEKSWASSPGFVRGCLWSRKTGFETVCGDFNSPLRFPFPRHALRLGELPQRQSCTCQFEAAVTT